MIGYVFCLVGLVIILVGMLVLNQHLTNKFRGIFLDDERTPSDVSWIRYDPDIQWTIVRNFAEFKDEIKSHGIPKYMSFDHDLADFDESGREYTGLTCAKYLVDVVQTDDVELPEHIYYHTKNPIGLANIKGYIENYIDYKNRII